MKNQGVGAWSSLGFEDFTDRFQSKAQPAEAVDRFRGESDQIALLQNLTGLTNGILGNGENPGLHRWRVGEKDALGKLRTFFSTCPHRGLHAGEVSLSPKDWQAVVREAAARAAGEDVGPTDVTSRTVIPEGASATAILVAKEACVLAGLEVAEAVFREVDGSLRWSAKAKDGDRIMKGGVVAEVEGSARSILMAERCALNFLQQLSGVATQTAAYVNIVKGTSARILDTRKTTPGLRALERHAVRCGGGVNHRTGLYDGILIKENHLIFISPTELNGVIKKARAAYPDLPLVVEADSVALAERLLSQPVDRILLDNLSPEQVTEVVALRAKMGTKVDLEASGGVTEEKALALAKAGVEWISVGGITHSARAMDFSLDIQPKRI